MTTGLRYKCKSCNWVGYRRNVIPCPKCGSDVERFYPLTEKKPVTEFEKKFIKQNYKKMLYLDIAKALGTTESRVCNYLNRAGLRLPAKEHKRRQNIGAFKPGQVAWNTGLSLPNIPNSGQFKKGNIPPNTKTDGAIVWRGNQKKKNRAYYWIRVALGKWKMLHVYLWEQKYGQVPDNKFLRFRDGDHRNCKLENIELVTRAEHLDRNRPAVRRDLIEYDRYIAARLNLKGKENQDRFIKDHPELIDIKRQQLFLQRGINERKVRRAS